MKIILSVCVALSACVVVFGAPQGNPNEDIKVVRYINDNNGIDSYKFT